MAEREKEPTAADASELAANSCYHDPPDLPKPAHEENGQSSSSQFSSDLKSVLVTSVLNLEQLDVDLYR